MLIRQIGVSRHGWSGLLVHISNKQFSVVDYWDIVFALVQTMGESNQGFQPTEKVQESREHSLELAIIGNCTYSAMIDRRGRIVFACLPR